MGIDDVAKKVLSYNPASKLGGDVVKRVKGKVDDAAEFAGIKQRNTVSQQRMAKAEGTHNAVYGRQQWAQTANAQADATTEAIQKTRKAIHKGSSAGLRNEKSAVIQYNGTGYNNAALMRQKMRPSTLTPSYSMNMRTGGARSYADSRMLGTGAAARLNQYTRTY